MCPCNDCGNFRPLMIPAMSKLMSSHLLGNTSVPLRGTPCTACLPCCAFFARLNEKPQAEKEEIRNLAIAAENIDWECKQDDCPIDFTIRNHLANKIEQHSAPLLSSMKLEEKTSEGTIQHVVRGHLDFFASEIKRNQNQRRIKGYSNLFVQNLFQCHQCTACPLECAVRELL